MPTAPAEMVTPEADELRSALVARAKIVSETHGITLSDIGKEVANDSALISDLEGGRNITLKLYDRLREYLDAKDRQKRGRRS